jgi:putative ATP-binding cassette transporter
MIKKRLIIPIAIIAISAFTLIAVKLVRSYANQSDSDIYPGTDGSMDLNQADTAQIDSIVRNAMESSKVPGVAVVMISKEQTKYLSYGFSDVEQKKKVDETTLFELGSMSKAYTALAVLKLEQEGRLSPDDSVNNYIPWLHFTYKGSSEIDMTIKNLLYHTSGIPFQTIGYLPEGNSDDMLLKTIQTLDGTELDFYPGSGYQYATINYDILALIIENITGRIFEEYMTRDILEPLGLYDTYMYREAEEVQGRIAQGYRYRFLKAAAYDAPVYRGNTAAGYIVSGITDMEHWMRLQLGLASVKAPFSDLIYKSHQPNITVLAEEDYYYAAGWEISMDQEYIRHGGSNPTYSSMVIMKPGSLFGICVLTNMNSNAARYIAENIIHLFNGEKVEKMKKDLYLNLDILFSVLSIAAVLIAVLYLALMVKAVIELHKKERTRISKADTRLVNIYMVILLLLFGGICVYYLPNLLLARLPWSAVGVWGSPLIKTGCILSYAAFSLYMIYVTFAFSFAKPQEKNYAVLIPLSLVNGISSALMIFIINETFNRNLEYSKELLVYYLFILIMFVYTIKLLQGRIIVIANELTYDKRKSMINKIINSSFESIEAIGQERIYTGLNNDANAVSGIPDVVINITSNSLTLLFCLAYLFFKNIYAFAASASIIGINGLISLITAKIANKYWEKNRNIQDTYFRQMNDLVYGFKELVLNRFRRQEFKDEMDEYSALSARFNKTASLKLLNFNLYNVLMYNIVFGVVVFLFPIFRQDIGVNELRENLFIVFYMIGPFGGLTNAIGRLAQLKVNIRRINELLKDLQKANSDDTGYVAKETVPAEPIDIELNNIQYVYTVKNEDKDDEVFTLGPINTSFHTGEITFIIGGNGSGKSTLGKITTGLYKASQGVITVNGRMVNAKDLNELFSAIYTDFHLFKRLYGIDFNSRKEDVKHYLSLLRINNKVKVGEDGSVDTLALSTGQKKRLAFVVSCLEEKNMILFDEWAAEQDPAFRNYFYRELLPMLKRQGKGIIVITHDNQFYDIADKVIELDRGTMLQRGAGFSQRVSEA